MMSGVMAASRPGLVARGIEWATAATACIALTAVGVAAMWMTLGWAGFRTSQLLRPSPMVGGFLSCWVLACALAGGFAARAIVRRWERRRISRVVRSRGACPACGYRLAGLRLSAGLEYQCPECDFRGLVAPELVEGSDDGAGGLRITMRRVEFPVFWTTRKRRIAKRASMALAALVFVVGPMAWGGYEWWLRYQAAAAKRELEAVLAWGEDRVAMADGAGTSGGRDVWTLLARTRARIAAIDARLPTGVVNGRSVYRDFAGLGSAESGRPRQETAEDIAAARNALAAYEAEGVFTELSAILEKRGFGLPPDRKAFMLAPDSGPNLDSLQEARVILRVLAGRAAVAGAANRKAEFVRTVEMMMAISRVLKAQPFVLEQMTGSSAEQLAVGTVREWQGTKLGSLSKDWLGEVMSAMTRQRREVLLADVIEGVRQEARATVAWQWSDPAKTRGFMWSVASATLRNSPMRGLKVDDPHLRLGSLEENLRGVDDVFVRVMKNPQGDGRRPDDFGPSANASPLIMVRAFADPYERVDLAGWISRGEMEWRGFQIMVAMERHRGELGTYPARIADLVPRFLDAEPADPLSGRGFTLERRLVERGSVTVRYRLISAGPDGVVDEPDAKGEPPRGSDDVFLNDPWR